MRCLHIARVCIALLLMLTGSVYADEAVPGGENGALVSSEEALVYGPHEPTTQEWAGPTEGVEYGPVPLLDEPTLMEQPEEVVVGLPNQIQHQWMVAFGAIQRGELKAVNEAVFELERLRIEAGFSALENISFYLLDRGLEAHVAGEHNKAGLYVRKALQLSPTSPRVLFKSLYLGQATGTAGAFSQFRKAMSVVWGDPALLLGFLKKITYPVLWALTIGCYLTFILLFAFRAHDILRVVARKLPAVTRGILAPIVAALMLCVPCFFGVLWTLAGWSVLLYLFLPKKRWVAMFAGAVLAGWGFVIPLRENVAVWLEDIEVQSMLRVASGTFSREDRTRLENLLVRRPDDGVGYFVLGQLLRKYEEYEQANMALQLAERNLGEQPWIKAEQGLVAFMQGDTALANNLFAEAEELGLDSAEFLFNYSKIKFDLLQTASARDYYKEAKETNPHMVAALKDREDKLGIKSSAALAEIRMPLSFFLSTGMKPLAHAYARSTEVAQSLMPGMSPWFIGMLGGALVVIFFVVGSAPERTIRLQTYYTKYSPSNVLCLLARVIPGGAWTAAGRPIWTLMLFSCFALACMPVLAWPGESAFILEAFPYLYTQYLIGLGSFCILLLFIGWQVEEK